MFFIAQLHFLMTANINFFIMCQMDLLYFFIVVRENEYRENNNIEIYFFLFSYFCLDTKVPKNQGKKNAARSAKPLSGSNKTRKRQAVLQEPLSCLSFTALPPLLFAGPARRLRGGYKCIFRIESP